MTTAAVETLLLSPRQTEVMELLARGLTAAQAGELLGMSFHTVKAHLRTVMQRTNTRNRAHAIAFYLQGTAGNLLGQGRPHRRFNPRAIAYYRKEAGLQRKDLAERVHMSLGAIDNYTSGRCVPTADTLALLADALGRSVDDFFDMTRGE